MIKLPTPTDVKLKQVDEDEDLADFFKEVSPILQNAKSLYDLSKHTITYTSDKPFNPYQEELIVFVFKLNGWNCSFLKWNLKDNGNYKFIFMLNELKN